MEHVTVSSKGQIAIPKQVREALNLSEGTKLTLEVRGHEIVLSKGAAWKKLRGALADVPDLMEKFAAFRKEEREREDSGL
jgi:AbrB family looped-hinge helix DNA binding protein